MSKKIACALVGAAFAASVTGAAAQLGAYSEPGFGYKAERPAARVQTAYPRYRWVDPATGQPYNLYSPAYDARLLNRRTGER